MRDRYCTISFNINLTIDALGLQKPNYFMHSRKMSFCGSFHIEIVSELNKDIFKGDIRPVITRTHTCLKVYVNGLGNYNSYLFNRISRMSELHKLLTPYNFKSRQYIV